MYSGLWMQKSTIGDRNFLRAQLFRLVVVVVVMVMEGRRKSSKGYAWALSAGLNAALSAIAAKLISSQIFKYGMVIFFNVIMWGCYVNSLKALSSLQATVTNFATNFLTSGLAGFYLFDEPLSAKWFAGALLIVLGVLVLSKSSVEKKESAD